MNRKTAPDGHPLSVLKPELEELERRLREDLGAGGPFLRREGLRLLDSGGKRLRPAMAISAGHLGVYERERVLPVATAVELIHMATLVHDDVIDEAKTRRSAATTFARHGAHTAVYAGDWLLVKALRSLSALDAPRADRQAEASVVTKRSGIPEALVAGLESLCSGEVDQYLGRGRIPSLRVYLSRIERKTAALFAASCAAGATASGLDEAVVRHCAAFGRAFGIAFQIQDDLLDVGALDAPAGKPTGHDLRQGIATLPFLLAARSDRAYRERLEAFFREAATADATDALTAQVRRLTAEMVKLGGVEAARRTVLRYENEAREHLSMLPASTGRDMLTALAGLSPAAR